MVVGLGDGVGQGQGGHGGPPVRVREECCSGSGWGADVDDAGGAVEEFPVPGDEGEGEALGEGDVDGVGAAEVKRGGEVSGGGYQRVVEWSEHQRRKSPQVIDRAARRDRVTGAPCHCAGDLHRDERGANDLMLRTEPLVEPVAAPKVIGVFGDERADPDVGVTDNRTTRNLVGHRGSHR